MTPLLETHQLCRQADDGTLLIEDLSVAFPAGSRTAIMGAPGSGKTLLLRLLAFLDPITSGEIRLRGNLVPDHGIPRARRQVQLISQKPVLIEGTVRENLRLPYSFRGNRDRMFDEAWHVEHLRSLKRQPDFLDRYIGELSGGESQIVTLLRGLQMAPVALLLDEPTSSLDEDTALAIESLIHCWLQEKGERTLVIVTHTEHQAIRLAERRVTMDRGRIVDVEEGWR